jgi:hypothetical protein
MIEVVKQRAKVVIQPLMVLARQRIRQPLTRDWRPG